MHWKVIKRLFVFALVGVLSCVEPYIPPNLAATMSRLAIDGYLDINQRTLTVKVYRAVTLSDPDQLTLQQAHFHVH